MKIKIFISFTLMFMGIITSLLCQDNSPTSINKNRLIPKPVFSLQDYKQDCEMRSDTIWLPRRQDTYMWNGYQLAKYSMYELLTYNSPDELAQLIIMDSNTDDSLMMANYEFDEQSQSVCEIFRVYDTINMNWKFDYKVLKSWDEFGCVCRNLIQAWDGENETWHDSIAEVIINVDTNENIEYYIEEYIDHEWIRIYGAEWVYYYTPEQYVYEQYTNLWNTEAEEYVFDVRAEYSLNDDGSYYESVWYRWDEDIEEWIYTQKYSDMEWAVYNKYPHNFKNKVTHRELHWWTGIEWYTYYKDDWEYPGPVPEDMDMHGYSMDNESEQWYLSNDFTGRNYPYGGKRRYTYYLRNSIDEHMKLFYDDSCKWYFYNGALEEMYRISYDTAMVAWRPAARLLYSDFVPFIDNTSIDVIKPREEKLKIIPNPSKNLVEIENKYLISELSLFDGRGMQVLHLVKQQNNPKIIIDVSQLPKGIYILKVVTEEKRVITDKLIVN